MADLKILTSIAMKAVLEDLADTFRDRTSLGLSMTYGPTGPVFERCRSGATDDLVIAVPNAIDTLIEEGFVVAGSRRMLAKSVIGVAVKAGAPRPRIDTVANFKQALLDAKSVGYTDPATKAASGVHFARVLDDLGIADAVNAKTRYGRGGPVAEFLLTGDIEIAVQQLCEHMLVDGIDVVGTVPDEIQCETIMAAGLHTQAPSRDAAEVMVELLTAPRTHDILRRNGLFPLK